MTLKEQLEMNENKATPQALHVFWDIAPHLSIPISVVVQRLFPNHLFTLYERLTDNTPFVEGNKRFINGVKDRYVGKIQQSFFQQIFNYLPGVKSIVKRLFPEISLYSFLKILIFGPRHIILHGRVITQFNLFTLVLLKFFNKRIYLIHWGAKPYIGKHFKILDQWSYKFFSHIFVLMSPEIEYFAPLVGKRVSCLPYFYSNPEAATINIKARSSRSILLGNSTHYRDLYREVLDKLKPGDWDKITCMLNYGDEVNQDKTDIFVKEYQAKFGDAFYAWRETLPLEEYRKVLAESAFYICIAKEQAGLGAISNSIRQGKTLILRGDNYKWMTSLGVKAYNYDEITDFSFDSFSKLLLTREEAQASFNNFYKNALSKYSDIFWATKIVEIL